MPFKPGKSGNPKGRQSSKPFADALRMEIAQLEGDRRGLRKVARKLITKAEEGDMQAIKELADRLDGKAVQQTELTGKDGGPIETRDKTKHDADAFTSAIASQAARDRASEETTVH